MVTRSLALLATLLGLTACSPRASIREGNWRLPPAVLVRTPGVVIEAADGHWRLEAGQAQPPPFYAFDCVGSPVDHNSPLAEYFGAQPVRIHYPGVAQPLEGLLALCRIHVDADESALAGYEIDVPPADVARAMSGRTTVLYHGSGRSIGYALDNTVEIPSWALWIGPPRQ